MHRRKDGTNVNVSAQNRKPMGHEFITDLSSSTALTEPTANTENRALIATFQPELNALRWRDDGTAPTTSVGMLLEVGKTLEYIGNLGAIRFIENDLPLASWAIDTNFDVQNTEVISYTADGTDVALAVGSTCDTGTAKTIAIDQWAAMLISGDSGGNLTGTWTADAADEAAALVLLKALAVPDGETPLGYITVLTGSGLDWTAGTDALQGGAGGDPSDDTNYFDYRATKLNVAYYE